MKIGYARVSTYEQTLELQIDQLQAAGCAPDSTSTPTRKVLSSSRALAYARAGNQLVIWRLDRLGRSLKDFIEQVANSNSTASNWCRFSPATTPSPRPGKALFQISAACSPSSSST